MLNKLESLIVLILNNSDTGLTGYELTKIIPPYAAHKHSHQQIYRALASLAKQDLIKGEHIPQQGKPNKIIYKRTSKQALVNAELLPYLTLVQFGLWDQLKVIIASLESKAKEAEKEFNKILLTNPPKLLMFMYKKQWDDALKELIHAKDCFALKGSV